MFELRFVSRSIIRDMASCKNRKHISEMFLEMTIQGNK